MTIDEAIARMRELLAGLIGAGCGGTALARQARDMLAAAERGDLEDWRDGGADSLMAEIEWALAEAVP